MSAMQRRRRWKWREPPALLTLEECATKLGITPQRVQQLERQALRKLHWKSEDSTLKTCFEQPSDRQG